MSFIGDDKHNNTIENLEWVTNSENQLHKYKLLNNGRDAIFEKQVKRTPGPA